MTPHREDNRFDILRLFAAWLVLFSHAYPLGGRGSHEPLARTLGIDTLGGVGVSIFFVLSGYLVYLSLERSPTLLEFARRRALRIYPALLAVCLLCVLVLGPWMTTWPLAAYWRHGLTWSYLQTASAWLIQYPLPGVFHANPHPVSVNGALWSLPYEITCYGGLALVSRLPFGLRYKTLLLGAGLATMLLLRPGVAQLGPFNTYWGMDYYHVKLGLLFVLGAGFAGWRAHIRPTLWQALLLLAAALVLPPGAGQLLLYWLGVGTLALWLALQGRWLPRVPPRLGDWSYGAYLYGFPVQQVLAHYQLHQASFVGYVLASTLVTLVLAGLSWHLVEKQALRWK